MPAARPASPVEIVPPSISGAGRANAACTFPLTEQTITAMPRPDRNARANVERMGNAPLKTIYFQRRRGLRMSTADVATASPAEMVPPSISGVGMGPFAWTEIAIEQTNTTPTPQTRASARIDASRGGCYFERRRDRRIITAVVRPARPAERVLPSISGATV